MWSWTLDFACRLGLRPLIRFLYYWVVNYLHLRSLFHNPNFLTLVKLGTPILLRVSVVGLKVAKREISAK
jgi:hypothetical protein